MSAASTSIRSLAALEANVNVKVKPAEIAAIDPLATKAEPRSANAPSRTTKLDTELARRIVAPILGLLIFTLLWGAVAQVGQSLPGPVKTWQSAAEVFSDPFYRNGPNDQGIGWNVLVSCSASALVLAWRQWSVFRLGF